MIEISSTLLGESTAEDDNMLKDNFISTKEYKLLFGSSDKTVVVGRRGSGKSALFLMLKEHHKINNHIIEYAPESSEIAGLRSIVSQFLDSEQCAKDVVKNIWLYGIYMEVLTHFFQNYKTKNMVEKNERIINRVNEWLNYDKNEYSIVTKIKKYSEKTIFEIKKEFQKEYNTPEEPNFENIASCLPQKLILKNIEKFLHDLLANNKQNPFFIIMDKLDEGYESDQNGISVISGMINACIHANNKFKKIKPTIFIRDNIFRLVKEKDTDFSRNIEGKIIRLQWDEITLLKFMVKRISSVFDNNIENINDINEENISELIRIWNSYTTTELNTIDGFKKCLNMTLSKPRDLLLLLNQAFFLALQDDREKINLNDIKEAAKRNSEHRLSDLKKEYHDVFPALEFILPTFNNQKTKYTFLELEDKLQLINTDAIENRKSLPIIKSLDSNSLIQILYSVGFIGLYNENHDNYLFTFDGKLNLLRDGKFLIHPCYWLALNVNEEIIDDIQTEKVNEEYDESAFKEHSKKDIKNTINTSLKSKIKALKTSISNIHSGTEDANKFEIWCKDALELLFSSGLSNIELHPNKEASNRRDIVARNCDCSSFWNRVLNDYNSRQIIFEIKNYNILKGDEIRQASSYLYNTYGNLAFIICRSEEDTPTKKGALNYIREAYRNHNKMIIILNLNMILRWLDKFEKNHSLDDALNTILDNYERNYVNYPAKD